MNRPRATGRPPVTNTSRTMSKRRGAQREADSQIARLLADGERYGAVDSGGGQHGGDHTEEDDQRDHVPQDLGHLVDPTLQDTRDYEHAGVEFAKRGAHGKGAGLGIAIEAHSEYVAIGMGAAHQVERRVLGAAEAYRIHILRHTDDGGR